MGNGRGWRVWLGLGQALAVAAALWAVAGAAHAAQSAPAPGVCGIETSGRIVAVGDVHGAFDRFVAILREAGIIDSRRRWAGGRAIFVQTGDILDRGPDSRKALDLLRALEGEAARAGGRVYALLGNHEVMRLINDRRYISAAEYDAFKSPDSPDLRERALQFLIEENERRARAAKQTFDAGEFRKKFLEDNPPGAIEMQIAFGPDGDYGRWVRQRNVMVKINGILFVHGGVSPAVAALGCAGVNDAVRAELAGPMPPPDIEKALITSPDGPLWYRGLVDGETATDPAGIDATLQAMGARAIVVGHTATTAFRIRSLHGGRVMSIDTGMLGGEYFKGGVASALEIAGGAFTAIYEGRREPLTGPAIARPTDR